MDIKKNDATINRPEGERLINAPVVQINIDNYIQQLKHEKAWETNDRNAITVFKTHGVTIVISALHKNAVMEDVQVDGLLLLQVVQGRIEIGHAAKLITLTSSQQIVLSDTTSTRITAISESILQLSYVKLVTAPADSVI